MVERRFYLIFLAIALFIGVLNAERVRYDDLQDDDFEFVDDERDGRIS